MNVRHEIYSYIFILGKFGIVGKASIYCTSLNAIKKVVVVKFSSPTGLSPPSMLWIREFQGLDRMTIKEW